MKAWKIREEWATDMEKLTGLDVKPASLHRETAAKGGK